MKPVPGNSYFFHCHASFQCGLGSLNITLLKEKAREAAEKNNKNSNSFSLRPLRPSLTLAFGIYKSMLEHWEEDEEG